MSDYEDQEDENEEQWTEDEYSGLSNIAIILIDICASMFDESRPIKKCLAAVYRQMDKMLLRGYKRNIAVCFLRDDDIIFTGLNDNLIESISKVLDLLKKSTDQLQQELERKSPPSLRYTFTECLKQMKNLSKINPHIVLLTNDDDPHKGDLTENLSAVDVALSFKDSNIKLIVLPLKEQFNYELFYSGLLKAANDIDVDTSEDKVYSTVDDIYEILESIIKNKVSIRRYNFTLFSKAGQELSFWTQLRYLVKSTHLYSNCNISRVTNNQVKLEYLDQSYTDLDKYLVKIPLEKDIVVKKNDLTQMREQMPVGFRLLYVTKHKRTSIHYLHRRTMILQNDESGTEVEYPKKQKLFDDLWFYCRENKKYLICAYLGSGIRQVPHIIEFTPDIFQNKPCFLGQTFANVEEVGDFPSDDEATDTKSSKTKIPENERKLGYFCEMIDKLTIKNFTPSQFTCYDYEVNAAVVTAQLLDSEVAEVEDCFPSNEDVKEKLGDTYEMLRSIITVVEEPKPKRSRKK